MVDRSKVRATTGLRLHRRLIQMEFAPLKDFIQEIGNIIDSKATEIENKITTDLKRSPHLEDQIVDYFIDEIHRYRKDYVGIFLSSVMISTYSLFERSFVKTCMLSQMEFASNVPFKKNMRIGIIKSCKDYIENTLKQDLSQLDRTWIDIVNYKEIRNFIVHNDSCFIIDKAKPIDEQKMYAYIESNLYLEFLESNERKFRITDHRYVLDFCDKSIEYLLGTIDILLT